MIDFLEFNLRKVITDNTSFCANKCKMFDSFDETLEKEEFSCFEKCLGKFSDGYDQALNIFGENLKAMN